MTKSVKTKKAKSTTSKSKKSYKRSSRKTLKKLLNLLGQVIFILWRKTPKQELKVKLTPNKVSIVFTSPDFALVKAIHDGTLVGLGGYLQSLTQSNDPEPEEQTRVLGFVQHNDEEKEDIDGD